VERMIVDNTEIAVSGRFRRVARLRAEFYDYLDDPIAFLAALRTSGLRADLFTFLQEPSQRKPMYDFQMEAEEIAALPITSYEHWWKRQLNDKTRNMIRKAQKSGIQIRPAELDDEFVKGILDIYNESPLRQGKPFAHYGKDFETTKMNHISFADRSEFIGAYYGDELVGFAKIVHGRSLSSLMQIISKIGHRNRAPTNALIAKSVEICAERGVPYLHYGVWSKRGLGDFKKHHGFEPLSIPRYTIPLNLKGKIILSARLHRKLSSYVPEQLEDDLVRIRARWNAYRTRKVLRG
jgi:hypothetical protein